MNTKQIDVCSAFIIQDLRQKIERQDEERAHIRAINAELAFRLKELLTTAEACEELHQHYKILSGGKEDQHEPGEFALARAALEKAKQSDY
jgi:hypothetical protein